MIATDKSGFGKSLDELPVVIMDKEEDAIIIPDDQRMLDDNCVESTTVHAHDTNNDDDNNDISIRKSKEDFKENILNHHRHSSDTKDTTSWWEWFSTSQYCSHLLLFTFMLLFGGFCVFNTISIKYMHPIIFSFLRVSLTFTGMIPLALIIDWRFQFEHSTDQDNRLRCSTIGQRYHLLRILLYKIPDWNNLLLLAVCGTVLILNQILFSIGLSLTNPTIAGVTQPFAAIFTCILAIVMKQEPKSLLKVVGVIIAVVGSVFMLLVSGMSKSGQNGLSELTFTAKGVIGCLLLLANTLCFAAYFIVQKVLLNRGIPPVTVTAWSFGFGWIVAFLAAIYFLPSFHPHNVPLIGYIGVLYSGIAHGVISFSISTYAARYTSPTVVGIYETLAPVFSMIFAYIFLRETTTWLVLVGGVIIMFGVLVVIIARYREERTTLMRIEASEIANSKADLL